VVTFSHFSENTAVVLSGSSKAIPELRARRCEVLCPARARVRVVNFAARPVVSRVDAVCHNFRFRPNGTGPVQHLANLSQT